MNYHIMADALFVDWFITAAEKVAPMRNIYIVNAKKSKYIKSENIVWAPIGSSDWYKYIDRITAKDAVFVHWLSSKVQKEVNKLVACKGVTTGVFLWGGDFFELPENYYNQFLYDKVTLKFVEKFYNTNFFKIQFNRYSIKSFIKRLFKPIYVMKFMKDRQIFLRNLDYFFYLDKGDIQWVKEKYGLPKAKPIFFFYGTQETYGLQIPPQNVTVEKKTVRIMVGNSGTESNNHLEAFQLLLPYKNENIELIIPLSYGTNSYCDIIAEHAINLFGQNKVFLLRNFMSFSSYLEMLDSIDIVLMNHNRQQAVGNITLLLSKGKKIFMKNKNHFAQTLVENDIIIYDILNLSNIDFEIFSQPLSYNDKIHNFNKLKALFNEEVKLNNLSTILNTY